MNAPCESQASDDIRGLYLGAEAVSQRLPMPDAIRAMQAAFGEDAENPARMLLGHSFFMPGRVGGFSGIKVVSTKPGNPTGLVTVYDAGGTPIGTVHGATLTAIRTGAGSGLATRLLARQNASHLAMLGAGKISAEQVEAVCCVRDIERVVIWSRRKEAAQALVTHLHDRQRAGVPYLRDIAFETTLDANEAVGGADIVNCATPSRAALFDASAVNAGTHINAVGAFAPDMVEVPAATVERALVYVDERGAALREAGDIIQAHCSDMHTLTELLAQGAKVGRKSDDHVTLFKSVGIASQDVAGAVVALLGIDALMGAA